MIRSMTGFGSARREEGPLQVQVDIRSVNNRFFDFQSRLSRELQFLEGEILERLKQSQRRGRINVAVSVERSVEERKPQVNPAALQAYMETLDQLVADGKFAERGSAAQFLNLPDLFMGEEASPERDDLRRLVMATLDEALADLTTMKEREGAALADEIRERHVTLIACLERIEAQAPEAKETLRQNLEKRLEEVLGEAGLDPQRLAMEAAILVDRADITEEMVRLRSHLDQLGQVLADGGEVGKRLGFLLQEILREANTIGSKAQALALIQEVLLIKEEVEKIREQIQNLE